MSKQEFVTKDECFKTHDQITGDLTQMKKALVGDDMRGGIVKDVADTKKDIAEIKTALKKNSERNGGNNGNGISRKQQAIIYSTAITTGGLIVMKLIEVIAH